MGDVIRGMCSRGCHPGCDIGEGDVILGCDVGGNWGSDSVCRALGNVTRYALGNVTRYVHRALHA